MPINKVAAIVRGKNEVKWLPKCIQSLKAQIDIKVDIFYIDNLSTDNSEELASALEAEVVVFDDLYLPGKMLNYGYRSALRAGEYDAFLFISAHCIVVDEKSVASMIKAINEDRNARSCFGRQLPAFFSPLTAVRDMVQLYPKNSSKGGSSIKLNNAFSLITKEALLDHDFDETVSSVEDFLWSISEVERGYSIKYVPEAEVIHYHGPHHDQDQSRLEKTVSTLSNFQEKVDYRRSIIPVVPDDFCVVFASQSEISQNVGAIQQVSAWAKANGLSYLELNDEDLNGRPDVSLREKLKMTFRHREFLERKFEYFIVFDDTFDLNAGIPEFSHFLKIAQVHFPDAILPCVQTFSPMFRRDEAEVIRIDPGDINRSDNPGVFVGMRGNGWCVHLSYIFNDFLEAKVELIEKFDEGWRVQRMTTGDI